MKRRVGVLISGRGSNMLSLVAAARGNDYPAEISLVLSNRPDAPGLKRATVPTAVVDHRPFRGDRAAHEATIAERLDRAGVEIICLAGYMRLLTPFFVQRYAARILNIHPSLLPAFPGLDTHARALAAASSAWLASDNRDHVCPYTLPSHFVLVSLHTADALAPLQFVPERMP